MDARLSWVATAGTVTRGWLDNRLPVRYAERVLDEAHEQLISNDDSTSASIVASLSDAVRRRDRAATAAPIASLVNQWSQLHEQSQKLKGSQ